MTIRGGLRVALVLSILAALLVDARDVLAHSEYRRSEPAAGTRVGPPTRVDVWFTQELFRRAGANAIEVRASDDRRVDQGEAEVDADDRTHLSVGVAPLDAGTYRVTWRSLSALDGDTAEGNFEFTVDPSAPTPGAATAASAVSSTSDEPGSTLVGEPSGARGLWWVVVAAAALAVTGVLGIRAVRAPFEDGTR
ncbi:MAG: copper resistance protein CopC [Dehalococcoidia bacterium]